jgi:hypothetical protein
MCFWIYSRHDVVELSRDEVTDATRSRREVETQERGNREIVGTAHLYLHVINNYLTYNLSDSRKNFFPWAGVLPLSKRSSQISTASEFRVRQGSSSS